jgi:hypothetical protein
VLAIGFGTNVIVFIGFDLGVFQSFTALVQASIVADRGDHRAELAAVKPMEIEPAWRYSIGVSLATLSASHFTP